MRSSIASTPCSWRVGAMSTRSHTAPSHTLRRAAPGPSATPSRSALARRAVDRDMPVLGHLPGDGDAERRPRRHAGTEPSRSDPLRPPPAHARQLRRPRGQAQPGSLAARAAGAERLSVKSHHHQGVDALGDGLVATGWAEPDDVVEAIELPGRRSRSASSGTRRRTREARSSARWSRRRGAGGSVIEVSRARDREGHGRGPARGRRGGRCRRRRREGGVPGVARGRAGRARGGDAPARRRDRGRGRRARHDRGAQRGQADLGRPRRDRDGRRVLPLLRRRRPSGCSARRSRLPAAST